MKVRFDATFEDFVDICKRSQDSNWSSYTVLICVVAGCSASLASLVHWIFDSWPTTLLSALSGCVAGAYSVIKSQDKLVRDHLKKQVDENIPVPTDVEINEDGVTIKCLGHTVMQEWSIIETIEETDEAIYFRNKFGQYSSARKRGFGSEAEMSEFLARAHSLHRQSIVPKA